MKMLRHCLSSGLFLLSSAVIFMAGIKTPAQTSTSPPAVSIVSPSNGSVFYTPTNIQLIAKASDSNGTVSNVEFFADSTDLGPGSPIVLDPPGVNGVTGLVYVLNWQGRSPTNYSLIAVATDNHGLSTVSSPINISVLQGPPPSNPPFSVRIISPPNNSVFFAPVNVPIFASVTYPPGSPIPGGAPAVFVQFFDQGTNSLGFGQPIPSPVAAAGGNSSGSTPIPAGYPTNVFFLVWTNPPPGGHALTAVAIISYLNPPIALRLQSTPVDVTILPLPPPPTNRPAIVNIVATDPVAVEGTNSWVWMGESNSPPTWVAWPSAVRQCFTNCGPKTATFTVHRFGETNDDLTVNYSVGGTASNGVDYVELPGYVTEPAGERSAFITIVPINHNPSHVTRTVILTLEKSTNVPPDYVVGIPPRAAAIIVNPPGPTPVASALADKCFRLSMPGPDGAWFSIECSTDLVNWASICTNQVVNGSIDFVDPNAPVSPGTYYRVVPVASAPED